MKRFEHYNNTQENDDEDYENEEIINGYENEELTKEEKLKLRRQRRQNKQKWAA